MFFLLAGGIYHETNAEEQELVFVDEGEVLELTVNSSFVFDFDSRQLYIDHAYQGSYDRFFEMIEETIKAHPEEMLNIFLSKHITYFGEGEYCFGFRCDHGQ